MASWPMKPRMSSASLGSLTNGSTSSYVATNHRSAAGSTTLSSPTMSEATGWPGIQCSGLSEKSKCTLRGWICIGPGSTSSSKRCGRSMTASSVTDYRSLRRWGCRESLRSAGDIPLAELRRVPTLHKQRRTFDGERRIVTEVAGFAGADLRDRLRGLIERDRAVVTQIHALTRQVIAHDQNGTAQSSFCRGGGRLATTGNWPVKPPRSCAIASPRLRTAYQPTTSAGMMTTSEATVQVPIGGSNAISTRTPNKNANVR